LSRYRNRLPLENLRIPEWPRTKASATNVSKNRCRFGAPGDVQASATVVADNGVSEGSSRHKRADAAPFPSFDAEI
jgi:hypothetical protein